MTPSSDVPYAGVAAEQRYEVSPLELLFDLVFVFAVSQLSHHLADHVSWRAGAETVVMLFPILAVWSFTSWAVTMIPVDRAITIGMVLSVMLLGLFMNAAVPSAFAESGWAFVIPLLVIQVGRTVWTIAAAPNLLLRNHYVRVLLWLIATSPLWIAGAAANPNSRLAWWACAAFIDAIGTWFAHPIPGTRLRSENIHFDADHMLERCRLFLLIALGETILTTGSAIGAATLTPMTVITGTSAMVGTVALWDMSFGATQSLVDRHLEESNDPIRSSRYAVNALMIMVAGLIGVAVANEDIVAHPHEPTSIALCLLASGGPVIFLAAQAWYLWAGPRKRPLLQLTGALVLVVIGCVAIFVPAYITSIFISGALLTFALLNRRTPQEN